MAVSKRSVLLVHGLGDTARVFDTMVAYLRDRGWQDIHAVTLTPSNGEVGLAELAVQVQAYVGDRLAGKVFDLVGFSMGGIVSRYYVQRLGGAQRVNRLITLSSPHNGTWTGYLRQNLGARQMRPGSPFLQDLNRTVHELAQVGFVSVWTPFDLMIVPASSSQLPVGEMIQLSVLAHPLMLRDRNALETVVERLDTPIESDSH